MKVYDGTGLLQTYTNGNSNSASNKYGPFSSDTGSDLCGGDSVLSVPKCSSCGVYHCCSRKNPCTTGMGNNGCWLNCYGYG